MPRIMAFSISIISDSLKKIGKVIKKLVKWLRHEIGESQSFRHFEVFSMLHRRNSNDPLLDCIVTCVEKWNGSFMIILNDPINVIIMTKPPPPSKKYSKSKMVTIWYWCYPFFLESNQILSADVYWNQLNGIRIQLNKLWSGLVNRRCPILLHVLRRWHCWNSSIII